MRTIYIFILLVITPLMVHAHPWKPQNYIVIDTDGGIDDYRTICLLLSAPNVRVLAITASAGVLDAEKTAYNVKALLNSLHHEGIPVAVNRYMKGKGKNFGTALNLSWGSNENINSGDFISIDSLASYLVQNFKYKIDFINIGSLNTVDNMINKNKLFSSKLNRIIWCNGLDNYTEGFNYKTDPDSYNSIRKIKNIPFEIVNGEGKYTDESIKMIKELDVITAKRMSLSFSQAVLNHHYGKKVFDELAVVYIHFPEKFKKDSTDNIFRLRLIKNTADEIGNSIQEILKLKNTYPNQIIKLLPIDTTFYQQDVHFFMKDIVKQHGITEWNTVITTFEIHRHIGIYALIGAKMGIRAREYFGAGVDEMKIVSYAGYKPPISCMNDGIQVSTGATLGHGLIRVDDSNPNPFVDFTYINRKIRLKLKPEIAQKIKSEIKAILKKHSLNDDLYWDKVRELAIINWLMLSRYDIFELEVLD